MHTHPCSRIRHPTSTDLSPYSKGLPWVAGPAQRGPVCPPGWPHRAPALYEALFWALGGTGYTQRPSSCHLHPSTEDKRCIVVRRLYTWKVYVLRGKQSGRVAARTSTELRYIGLNCDLGKSRVGNLFLT